MPRTVQFVIDPDSLTEGAASSPQANGRFTDAQGAANAYFRVSGTRVLILSSATGSAQCSPRWALWSDEGEEIGTGMLFTGLTTWPTSGVGVNTVAAIWGFRSSYSNNFFVAYTAECASASLADKNRPLYLATIVVDEDDTVTVGSTTVFDYSAYHAAALPARTLNPDGMPNWPAGSYYMGALGIRTFPGRFPSQGRVGKPLTAGYMGDGEWVVALLAESDLIYSGSGGNVAPGMFDVLYRRYDYSVITNSPYGVNGTFVGADATFGDFGGKCQAFAILAKMDSSGWQGSMYPSGVSYEKTHQMTSADRGVSVVLDPPQWTINGRLALAGVRLGWSVGTDTSSADLADLGEGNGVLLHLQLGGLSRSEWDTLSVTELAAFNAQFTYSVPGGTHYTQHSYESAFPAGQGSYLGVISSWPPDPVWFDEQIRPGAYQSTRAALDPSVAAYGVGKLLVARRDYTTSFGGVNQTVDAGLVLSLESEGRVPSDAYRPVEDGTCWHSAAQSEWALMDANWDVIKIRRYAFELDDLAVAGDFSDYQAGCPFDTEAVLGKVFSGPDANRVALFVPWVAPPPERTPPTMVAAQGGVRVEKVG